MVKNIIEDNNIYLRKLNLDDDLSKYLSWVNDKEMTVYMELRHKEHSIETLKRYIGSHLDSNNYLCGIFKKSDNSYMGNVLLSNMDEYNRNCDVGIFIGKEYWGNGAGAAAVTLMIDYAFDVLKIHKVNAGVISGNVGSAKLFESVGFTLEGVKKEEFKSGDKFLDKLCFGKINNR